MQRPQVCNRLLCCHACECNGKVAAAAGSRVRSPHAWQYGERHEAHLRALQVHHQAAEEGAEAVLHDARRAWQGAGPAGSGQGQQIYSAAPGMHADHAVLGVGCV